MIWKILIFALLLPSIAYGQTTCAPRAMLATALFNVDGAVPVVGGLSIEGHLIELFISPGRTWTIVETDPQGLACTVSFGTALEAAAPVAIIVPQGVPG